MKIYVSKKNKPITHIDCIGTKIFKDNLKENEYSFHASE